MNTSDVQVRSIRALSGPNIHAYMSVLHILLDIGAYDHRASNEFPGFVERLVAWLPGLEKHECSLGRPGGFIERLRRGTYLAHIAEHIALELQNLMGFKVSFGRARALDEPGMYRVILAYKEETPARAAFDTALRLTLAAMHDTAFDIQVEIDRLLTLADEYRLGPSTAAIVTAAEKRDIPVIRLTPTGSLVQLGYGVYQKRILASETSNTSSIAVEMCQEKPLTNSMLRTVGVPVPEGLNADNVDEAAAAAQTIGYPVVVKPIAGNQGKGVSVNLNSEQEVRAAYGVAAAFDVHVLVERFIQGQDYRLLVVNGKLIAAARREAANVVGDGEHTIEQLIAIANQDPRRRPGHSGTLTQLQLDDAARMVLTKQALAPEDVPPTGQIVHLRTNCNLSTGGTATDVTDDVHPRNAQVAALAAQILALDVAGIDIVCQDISRPLHEQGGAVVEVNAAPGLRMHVAPTNGQPRDVATPIVDMLFPDNATARIPIIAVTGTNGKTTVTSLISHMYTTARWVVGMTSTEGTYINKERVLSGDCSGPRSARAVLLHPHVEVAVLETARGGILREGLAFDSTGGGNGCRDHGAGRLFQRQPAESRDRRASGGRSVGCPGPRPDHRPGDRRDRGRADRSRARALHRKRANQVPGDERSGGGGGGLGGRTQSSHDRTGAGHLQHGHHKRPRTVQHHEHQRHPGCARLRSQRGGDGGPDGRGRDAGTPAHADGHRAARRPAG
ncbi:MAG: cyanophycin synthetase [Chloroflexi bacterium]|nr:cyanophycin synthetase [Chloroflexota bacterium]